MQRKVNAQGLMDLIRANEEAPNFNLGVWEHPCGSYGCLVGNWAIGTCNRDFLDSSFIYRNAAIRFGMSHDESYFLFNYGDRIRDSHGRTMGWQPRDESDRTAAINRVRKFLYYKLRKWELLYEDDGRVKESARREEGDKHVCRRVLEAVG